MRSALSSAATQPLLILIESLEVAPETVKSIPRCLQEVGASHPMVFAGDLLKSVRK